MKRISLFALPLALFGAAFFLGGCGYKAANQKPNLQLWSLIFPAG